MIRKITVLSATILLTAGMAMAAENAAGTAAARPAAKAGAGSEPAAAPARPSLTVGKTPEELVRAVYADLTGRRLDLSRLAAAVDSAMLLQEATGGMARTMPEDWQQAAVEQLDARILNIVREMIMPSNQSRQTSVIAAAHAAGAQTDKSDPGLVRVFVRVLRLAQPPAWHQVKLRKTPAGWRIADVLHMEDGSRLSDQALVSLLAADNPRLKANTGNVVALILLRTLVAGLILALILGLSCYLLLVRPAKGGEGRGRLVLLNVLAVAGPLLAGIVMFLSALMTHLDFVGSMEKLERRARSMAITDQARGTLINAYRKAQGGFEKEANELFAMALEACRQARASDAWPGNRASMILETRILLLTEKTKEAEEMLQAMASKEMNPPMPQAHLELARIYERRKDWRKAAGSAMEFLNAVGDDAYVCFQVAEYMIRLNDYRMASAMVRRAEKAQKFDDPSDPENFDESFILTRAALSASRKDTAAAVADLKLVLKPFEGKMQNSPQHKMVFLQMCQNISQRVASSDFAPIHDDPGFKKFMNDLKARFDAVVQELKDSGMIRTMPGTPRQ